jgi:hypothetical protein
MITPTIILLAGALPLRMAAIFTSTVSDRAEKYPLKRLDNYHTCSMIREQVPMLTEGGTLRVQRKRRKVTLSEGADWKKWHNNQQSECGGMTKIKKNWHDNQPQITNMRVRGEGKRGRNQGKRNVGKMRQQQIQDPQIHQLNNGNQEWGTTRRKRERDDKWHNADELRNKN